MSESGATVELGAVVINYHRIGDSQRLVASLVADHGLDPDQVVLVSNGEDPHRLALARSGLPSGVRLVELPNPGYAAAVNHAFELLSRPSFLLVLTHDVELEASCVTRLVDHLVLEATCGAAGPLLLDARDPALVWSAGGTRSSWRRLPGHRLHAQPRDEVPMVVHPSTWLDGAVVLLRGAALSDIHLMPEEYFVYMEDVDLGGRLRARGWRVDCVPTAGALQAPGEGQSTFLAVRNFLWLLTAERSVVALPLFVVETLARLGLGWLKPGHRLRRYRERSSGLRHGLTDSRRPRSFR